MNSVQAVRKLRTEMYSVDFLGAKKRVKFGTS